MQAGRPQTFDLEALRSFVLGVELNSFALAATRLCRSTSAVSAQLKKLEQQAGRPLLQKAGRGLQLTDDGELLMACARRLLALNDEAFSALSGRGLAGSVCLGLQEDFGEALLPALLGQFARAHPQVQVAARIGRNSELLQGIRQGELDLALCWQGEQSSRFTEPLGALPLCWVGRDRSQLDQWLDGRQPLPLLLFDALCMMRSRAIDLLDSAGIAWRVAFTSRSLSGLWAAANAGLGITLRSAFGLPAGLAALQHPRLPQPGTLGIALHQKLASPDPVSGRLRAILLAQLVPMLPADLVTTG